MAPPKTCIFELVTAVAKQSTAGVYALEAILSQDTPALPDLYTVACRESPPSAYSELASGNKCILPHWPPLDEAKTPTVDQWSVVGAAVVDGAVVDGAVVDGVVTDGVVVGAADVGAG